MKTLSFVLGLLAFASSAAAITPVLTEHNDNARTGNYSTETKLNTSNVSSTTFGMLFTRNVDDQIYAQPLYVPGLTIPGQGKHNVVFVATVADSVYAFDADDPKASDPFWHVNLLDPGAVPPSAPDISSACGVNYLDFSGNFGIVGTPVIDIAGGVLYVVARSKEADGSFVQRLHALDITSGSELLGGPVLINPSSPGTGDGSTVDTFDALRENQRPALLLSNNTVYVSWASHDDCTPYHGWVVGYDAGTLQETFVYNDTPNGSQGGIWMSGQGPAADDDGNLFVATGNGTVDAVDFGNSVIKLSPSLSLLSFFTPYNYAALNTGDLDVGSGGVLLIPNSKIAIAGGKSAVIYVMDEDNLGGLSTQMNDSQILQSFSIGGEHIHGSPVFYSGPTGEFIYVWNEQDHMLQYTFDRGAGTFEQPYFAESPERDPNGMPGAMLALSSNGTTDGTGILWASLPYSGNAIHSVVPGILRAYDARNIGTELWNSEQVSSRDSLGNFAKFNPPTVANGRVYLGTFSNQLVAYGLLVPVIMDQPVSRQVVAGDSLTLNVSAKGAPLAYQWRRNGVAIPGATSAMFSKPNVSVGDAGVYDVVVSNVLGTETSEGATVWVSTPEPPRIPTTTPTLAQPAPPSSTTGTTPTQLPEREHSGCASAGEAGPLGLLLLLALRKRRG